MLLLKRCKKILNQNYRRRKLFKFASKYNLFTKSKFFVELELLNKFYLLYSNVYDRDPDLANPHDLNEKLLWLSYYWRNPLKSQCADKYKCREYVTKKCGLSDNILVPMLGVWSDAKEIDFNSLPDQFVLKCNHGCGYNIIVRNKTTLDIENAREQLNQWLLEDYSGNVSEIHYKDIKPHRIICEQYLTTEANESSVIDYKLMCFNGIPHFFFVAYNRNEMGDASFCTFSLEWKQLFYIFKEKKVNIPKPKSLDKMLNYAKILSKDFPFVRVDFYDIKGMPLLGEMTFTPYGNLLTYFKPDVIEKYGKLLRLPSKYKK